MSKNSVEVVVKVHRMKVAPVPELQTRTPSWKTSGVNVPS
jgi:hypothetical protein